LADLLIEAGADLNLEDHGGFTALVSTPQNVFFSVADNAAK
jgi:hypothetical protein